MRKQLEKVGGQRERSRDEAGEVFSFATITLEVVEEEDVGEGIRLCVERIA